MRSVQYDRTGGPDVLVLRDRPDPEPGPDEVVVRVHRSGVNPTDWKARAGSGPGTVVDPPQTPGHDGAGVVEAVGAGVDPALAGRRVWVWEAAHGRPAGGTAQELAVLPATRVEPLPDTASYDLGAALGVPFVTAHRCLTVLEDGPERLGPGALAGRMVLVTGGAGAVGNAAIQLARWSDATVLTTISSAEKARLAAAAGADHVIDYTRQDVVAEVRRIAPGGVDTIVEVAAAQNGDADAEMIAGHGTVAIYAGTPADTATFPVRTLMAANARLQFVLLYTAPERAKGLAVADVSAAVLAGAVRVGEDAGLPLHHVPLADAAAAHRAVQDGAIGKVLLDVT